MTTSGACKALMLVLSAGSLPAMPIVTFTVSGSTDDWTLNFTVDNTTDQSLYLFGVVLPTADLTGSPTGWGSYDFGATWTNTAEGGSSTVYNNNWITSGSTDISAGNSLSGFTALVTTASAPSSVQFFAYTCDSTFTDSPGCAGSAYTDGDNFSGEDNPGFEGIASPAGSAVPEPSALLLIAAGMGFLTLRRGTHRLVVSAGVCLRIRHAAASAIADTSSAVIHLN
jgi:hypothetical protein